MCRATHDLINAEQVMCRATHDLLRTLQFYHVFIAKTQTQTRRSCVARHMTCSALVRSCVARHMTCPKFEGDPGPIAGTLEDSAAPQVDAVASQ